ncbi:MAG: tetratricopeptide repeat protein [Candidatus Sumerlaeota bacterium]|nr:tetratricopeptide repeat protein [Candidatus Sumerlaeota bacterium]
MKIAVRIALVVIVAVVGYLAYQSRGRSELNNRGVKLMNEGKYKEAVEQFEFALTQEPGNEKIKKNLERAREELAAAGGESPTSATVKPAAGASSAAAAAAAGKPTDAQLRERIAQRIERLKASGWKNEDNMTLDQIMKTAEGLEQPARLDIETKIESLEAKEGIKN